MKLGSDLRIVFVIPAYNEQSVVFETIEEVTKAGHQVICIDDGSNDNTAQIARDAGAIVISHLINCGQGAAIQTGFDYICKFKMKPDFVVTFDSDGQHTLADLTTFLNKFDRNPGLDIVLGSRFLNTNFQGNFLKKVILKIMARLAALTFRLKITDRHNGYRMINGNVINQFKLLTPGYGHADEFLNLINKLKLSYAEVGTHIIYSQYSREKGQSLLNGVIMAVDRILFGWK